MSSGLTSTVSKAAPPEMSGTRPAHKALQKLGFGVIIVFTLKGLITTTLLMVTVLEFTR